MFEMVMARASAIACAHKDAIDLDRLRHDPLMKLAVRRRPDSDAAAVSQSTISRWRMRRTKPRRACLSFSFNMATLVAGSPSFERGEHTVATSRRVAPTATAGGCTQRNKNADRQKTGYTSSR
jgi:hypothetical protein